MAISQVHSGVAAINIGPDISTELATTAFGLAAGVFGGIAGLVAARRLESAPDVIPAGNLAIPVAVAGISTVLGAWLIPAGE